MRACRRSSRRSSRCRSSSGRPATDRSPVSPTGRRSPRSAAVDVVLFAIGVFAFTRRDLGASANVGWLRLPSLPAGIAGPFSRQLADRFGIAIAWGIGIGAYGILIVASADAFGEDDLVGPHARRGDRSGLSRPGPHPAVGAAPTHVLQLRLVHLRPGRSVVPRGLGRRRGSSTAGGRPVDAAIACQLGGPQRARRPGRDRGRDGHHRGPDRDRHRLAGPRRGDPGRGRRHPRAGVRGLCLAWGLPPAGCSGCRGPRA